MCAELRHLHKLKKRVKEMVNDDMTQRNLEFGPRKKRINCAVFQFHIVLRVDSKRVLDQYSREQLKDVI